MDIEVVHITEALAPMLESGDLNLGGITGKYTYHDPCSLGRCSRIFDAPRQFLEAVKGLELVEMEQNREKALCCGGSPWVHCGAVNRKIQEERLRQAQVSGADVLVTACPKCQIHLRCAQNLKGDTIAQIDIQDLAHLLSESRERG